MIPSSNQTYAPLISIIHYIFNQSLILSILESGRYHYQTNNYYIFYTFCSCISG